MSEKDKYLVLFGLGPQYGAAELKEAYRVLSKVWHPDRFARNEKLREKAEDKTKEINQGYRYLSDQLQKKENLAYGSGRNNPNGKNDARTANGKTGPAHRRHRGADRNHKVYNNTPSFRPRSIFKWWILIPFMFLIFAVPLIPVLLHSEEEKSDDRNESYLEHLFGLERDDEERAEGYSMLNSGMEKYENGEYREALHQIDLAINQNPNFPKAYLFRGMVNSKLEDETYAIRDYTYAIDLDPADPLPYYGRGLIYKNNGRYKDALTDFDRAITRNPEIPELYVVRGRVKFIVEDYEGAIRDFSRAIELDSGYSRAYASRALARYSVEDFENAREDFDRAVALASEGGSTLGLTFDREFGDHFYNSY